MRGSFHNWHAARPAAGSLVLLVTLAVLATGQPTIAKTKHPNKIVREDGVEFSIRQKSGNVVAAVKPSTVTDKSFAPKGQLRNLPPIPNGAESIIGPDERTRVTSTSAYPSSAIAQLEVDFAGLAGTCTGWFIDGKRLATAAHCLYDGAFGGFATAITVYPGRNGATEPFGHYSAVHWYVINKYITTSKPKFDYGVVELGTDVGALVGSLGYAYDSTNTILPNKKVQVRGYPGDKEYGTLWTMSGRIGPVKQTRFFYAIDTFNGQSGSPTYGKWGKACRPCSFGIHTYSVDWEWNKNSANRITPQVFRFLGSAGVP